MKLIRFVSAALAIALVSVATPAMANDQRLLQMLDYIGVDYPPTVSAGEVVDPVEYAEMQEFSGEVVHLLHKLPESRDKPELLAAGVAVRDAIEAKAEGARISRQTASLKNDLIRSYNIVVGPGRVPDMGGAKLLYETSCASCHGESGFGDGPLAAGMEPAPSNFHDDNRQYTRSVYDLYNTISLGVPETPMASYSHLTDEQRWALALLVSRFSTTDAQVREGKLLYARDALKNHFRNIDNLTGTSPAMAADWAEADGYRRSEGIALLAYLRNHPSVLEVSDNKALDRSIAKLGEAMQQARNGNMQAAHSAALSSYLDGFELAEASVVVLDKQLKQSIERGMITFRNAAKDGDLEQLETSYDRLLDLLTEARLLLAETGMSGSAAFAGSFIILLREGVEAILVLAAIMAALLKTGRREAMKYIHLGWVSAVVLGIATWWVADNLISISGASREITEGVAALIAAGILVYVGFWLHNASHSKRWKQFVEHKVGSAMKSGTLWVLAFVSFIAVYREMFETVLFYQALWVQVDTGSEQGFFYGIAAALVLLVAISVLVFKLGTRLPIRQFFQINAVLLFALAVVFTGQGISALQEAGMIETSFINFPRVELLGIYPTAQSLGLQLLVLMMGVGLMMYQRRSS